MVHDCLIGEFYVFCIKLVSVMEFHAFSQTKNNNRIMFNGWDYLWSNKGYLIRVIGGEYLNIITRRKGLKVSFSKDMFHILKKVLVYVFQCYF